MARSKAQEYAADLAQQISQRKASTLQVESQRSSNNYHQEHLQPQNTYHPGRKQVSFTFIKYPQNDQAFHIGSSVFNSSRMPPAASRVNQQNMYRQPPNDQRRGSQSYQPSINRPAFRQDEPEANTYHPGRKQVTQVLKKYPQNDQAFHIGSSVFGSGAPQAIRQTEPEANPYHPGRKQVFYNLFSIRRMINHSISGHQSLAQAPRQSQTKWARGENIKRFLHTYHRNQTMSNLVIELQ